MALWNDTRIESVYRNHLQAVFRSFTGVEAYPLVILQFAMEAMAHVEVISMRVYLSITMIISITTLNNQRVVGIYIRRVSKGVLQQITGDGLWVFPFDLGVSQQVFLRIFLGRRVQTL